MSQKNLSNKEKKDLNFKLSIYNYQLDKKDIVIEKKQNNQKIIIQNKEPILFYHNNQIIPTIKLLLKQDIDIKAVYVDAGALPFLTKGADLMRPGIQKFDSNINKDDIVVIKDIDHNKPITIGKSLYSSQDIENQEKGKTVLNLHYIGDSIWNA